MGLELSNFNVQLIQFLIATGLICAIAIIVILTAMLIVVLYRKAKNVYEKEEEKASVIKGSSKKTISKPNYVRQSLITVIIAAVLFIVMAIVANKKWGLAISPDDVVLTFIGVIATFVVVTNQAQVLDIKNEFKEQIARLDKRIKFVANKNN